MPSGARICASPPSLAAQAPTAERVVAAGIEDDDVELGAGAFHLAQHQRGIEHLKVDVGSPTQNPGSAGSSRPPIRTGAILSASPVASSVSTATPLKVATPPRRLETARGNAGRETAQRLFLLHADDRIVIAGHAGVGHVGGAAGENLMIGGRHMGMGADDEAGAAVAEEADALLFAGRLAMEVDHDGVGRCIAADRLRVRG